MPFAIVMGKALTEFPKDLYIPPHALAVFLEAFEGPLDLLLYLIKRQNLDILEIDVSRITEQYMEYVELMDAMQFELAAEYLLMAAMLAEIKSRMLLPRASEVDEDEEDPRAQLIRRLQEYERFKKAAEDIDELPRVERDTWVWKRQGTGAAADASRPGSGFAGAAAGPGGSTAPGRHVRQSPYTARGAVDARAHERSAGATGRTAFCAVCVAVSRV
ncbi:MAG: segregation/condensation protein A [Halioglobus sp.]